MATWQQMADDLKTDPALATLTEDQIEAVIDILVLTIHVDEMVGFMEEAELEHMLFELPWMVDKEAKVEAFVKGATEKAQGVKSESEYHAIVDRAAEKLTDPAVREKVYAMALTLANVDMTITESEHKVLVWLANAMQIPESQRAILGG